STEASAACCAAVVSLVERRPRPRPPPTPSDTKLTLKLDVAGLPESVSSEVLAFRAPVVRLDMLIWSRVEPAHELSAGPVVPLIVALAPVKLSVPKSASGSAPPRPAGASWIHSAEASLARLEVCVVLNVVPAVRLLSVRPNWPRPRETTEA